MTLLHHLSPLLTLLSNASMYGNENEVVTNEKVYIQIE